LLRRELDSAHPKMATVVGIVRLNVTAIFVAIFELALNKQIRPINVIVIGLSLGKAGLVIIAG
jgi:hypothetical protein